MHFPDYFHFKCIKETNDKELKNLNTHVSFGRWQLHAVDPGQSLAGHQWLRCQSIPAWERLNSTESRRTGAGSSGADYGLRISLRSAQGTCKTVQDESWQMGSPFLHQRHASRLCWGCMSHRQDDLYPWRRLSCWTLCQWWMCILKLVTGDSICEKMALTADSSLFCSVELFCSNHYVLERLSSRFMKDLFDSDPTVR